MIIGTPSSPAPAKPEAIVAGGSAGAFEAVSRLLAGLPGEFAIPIVIVLHLPRHGPNTLPKALADAIGRPVREPQDKEPLARSTVYVAPADYHLLIDEGGAFALSVDEPVNFSRPSIDVLFESAADVLGAGLTGILLSGANADGARGLRAIEAAGGLAIVQAPDGASSPEMPNAAIALCEHPRVLPIRDIRRYLFQFMDGGTAEEGSVP
jgi:two-component system chemotaxis response regulator CheB